MSHHSLLLYSASYLRKVNEILILFNLLLPQHPSRVETSAPGTTDATKKPQLQKTTEDKAPGIESQGQPVQAAASLLAKEEELKVSKVTTLGN
jgi:hypothetical protein